MATTYWIYTVRALENAIEPLVGQKTAKGYHVEIHFVDDITGSRPAAMRNRILGTRPDFLLLVGDHTFVPGYPLRSDHVSPPVFFDSDAYYSTPDGQHIPTVPTGRISSSDPGTVRRICDMLVAYPSCPSPGWRRKVLLSGWIPRAPSDPGYAMDASVQCLKETGHFLGCVFQFERDGTDEQKSRWHAGSSTKRGLVESINMGASIVRYLGHGSQDRWTNIGNREDFTRTDVSSIDSGGMLPLVISAACNTGNLDASPSLAEKWQESCKAVGFWGADTESMVYFNDRITQSILREIVSGRERCVGRILTRALRRLSDRPAGTSAKEFFRKTFLMYRYLGDPDTILPVPMPRKAVLDERSSNGPALAASNDALLIGWTGAPTNNRLNFMRSPDGINFSGKVTLSETSPESPALCRFGREFIAAWVGTGNHRINVMHSPDGTHWSEKVVLEEKSWTPPCLAPYGDRLYLAWRGGPGNGRINLLRSLDGISWGDKITLDLETAWGPALVSTASNLVLCWRGETADNRLNIMVSSDGHTFRNRRVLQERTTSGPALTNWMGRPMLSWAGVGNRLLNVLEGRETGDFQDVRWGGKITWPETCTGTPVIAKLGYDLALAWTGTDGRLNTMLYPVAL